MNMWKKIKSINWDTWLQRCAWIFGIITSIVMAVFTWQQVEINRELTQEKHMLQQPIFQVQKIIDKSEGSQIFDLTNLEIYNVGEIAKDISKVDIDSYLQFAYTPNIIKQGYDTCYIPLWCYYGLKRQTYNLTGLVAYTEVDYPNHTNIVRLTNEAMHLTKGDEHADISLITIVHISYIDKLNMQHTISFLNGDHNKEAQVAKIEKDSQERFDYHVWEIQKLTFDKLKEIWSGKFNDKN